MRRWSKAGRGRWGRAALELVAHCGRNSRATAWTSANATCRRKPEQERALNFSKGCYVGQEIVERIRSRGQVRRKFAGFEVDGALPAPGSKIQLDGKEVGEITSAASLPAGWRRTAAWRWATSAAKRRRPASKLRLGGSVANRGEPAVCGSDPSNRRKELCLRKSKKALP